MSDIFIRTIFILQLCTSAFFISAAQDKYPVVYGTVHDESQRPLPGITIIIEGTTKGTATNENGGFQIKGMTPGLHNLIITGIGFQKQKIEVHLSSGEQKELNIQMKEEMLQIKEAVIYGKSESTVLKEKGFAVNSIDTKDIELQSIQATDLLDRTAGVRIRQDGGLGSRIKYNINGLSGNSIRIFLNGIPMENYGASFSLSSIPTSLIERIEVYKGVVPAHLGDDALGGAINVITKTNAPKTLNFSYTIGSFNTHQVSLNGNYRDSKTGFTIRGAGFYNHSDNNYKVWGNKVFVLKNHKPQYIEAERFNDAYSSLGTKMDIGFTDVKWADQFLIGTVLSKMEKEIQHGVTMQIVYGNRRMKQSTKLIHANYRKSDFIIKGLEVDFFTSYSDLQRNVIDTLPYIYNWRGEITYDSENKPYEWASGAEGGEPTLNKDHEKNYTARVNLTYSLNERNRLILNYLLTDFAGKPDDPLRKDAERALINTRYLSKKILGISYENEAFNNKLKTSIFFKHYNQNVKLKDAVRDREKGIIAYHYNDKTQETGYGFALSYELFPTIRILSSAENALRLPENQEIFGNVAENINPAYNLKPERSLNVNIGVNLGPYIFNKNNFIINSNVFYRKITGMIKLGVVDQLTETAPYVNIDEIVSTGVDAEAIYSYDKKLTWTLGAALSNPRFNTKYDSLGAKYPYYRNRLRNESYLTANNNLRYSIENPIHENARISFYHNLSYVHEFFRNWESQGGANKDIIPTQVVNDFGVAYTFPQENITISFDARNIFNEQVFDNWALQKPGRAFYLKFNYKLD